MEKEQSGQTDRNRNITRTPRCSQKIRVSGTQSQVSEEVSLLIRKTTKNRANEKPINMVVKGPLSCRPLNPNEMGLLSVDGQANTKSSNRQAIWGYMICYDGGDGLIEWGYFMLVSHQHSMFSCILQDMQHHASLLGKFNNWPSSGPVLAHFFATPFPPFFVINCLRLLAFPPGNVLSSLPASGLFFELVLLVVM